MSRNPPEILWIIGSHGYYFFPGTYMLTGSRWPSTGRMLQEQMDVAAPHQETIDLVDDQMDDLPDLVDDQTDDWLPDLEYPTTSSTVCDQTASVQGNDANPTQGAASTTPAQNTTIPEATSTAATLARDTTIPEATSVEARRAEANQMTSTPLRTTTSAQGAASTTPAQNTTIPEATSAAAPGSRGRKRARSE